MIMLKMKDNNTRMKLARVCDYIQTLLILFRLRLFNKYAQSSE